MSLMAPKTTPFVLMVAAFVASLASVFAVLFVVAKPHVGSPMRVAAIGGPFQLIDQNGRGFTHADLQGRPFLVFFGFTHCPDACPTTLLELSDVLDKLGGAQVMCGFVWDMVISARHTTAYQKAPSREDRRCGG
jgi:protein SCO1